MPGWAKVVSYTVDFDDGSPSETSSNPVFGYWYTATGTYQLTVRVTDAFSQTSVVTAAVTVHLFIKAAACGT